MNAPSGLDFGGTTGLNLGLFSILEEKNMRARMSSAKHDIFFDPKKKKYSLCVACCLCVLRNRYGIYANMVIVIRYTVIRYTVKTKEKLKIKVNLKLKT